VEPATLPPSTARSRDDRDGRDGDGPIPGLVIVFEGGTPAARAIRVGPGPAELGRGNASAGKLDDGRVSRRHALIAFEDGRCSVTDLGSQNGTLVDGALVPPHSPTPAQRVIRIGDSLLVPTADVRPVERAGVRSVDGFVRGPAMQALLEDVARAALSGASLHIRGESGTGKEGIAQAFHGAGPRAGHPFVAVSCATIPHAIAERLLFGAKRGAYSGADADAPGYVQEADGGTLFLDEIAELEPQVQAKLLRVLESKEVLPLGSPRPRKVDVAFCSATNKDLRTLVATGLLREDLYFRIGSPAVTLPALRNRPEEIPALIAQGLATFSPALTAHVSLVEQCLLRPWPGNVRELLGELRSAALAALADGGRVEARHLPASAGSIFGSGAAGGTGGALGAPAPPPAPPPAAATDPHAAPPSPSEAPRKRTPQVDEQWRRRIEDALRANAGNIAATARALGLHRTQLRRLVERHGIAIPAGAHQDHDPTE
jgi:DNA-binding NtrC family response regulator